MDPIIPQPSEQFQYQTPVPEHKHFLNKKFIVTFIVLVLLGSSAYAGIWYWQKQQVANEVVPTFTPRADATVDWKTYTYKNILLKYPDNWRDVSDNVHAEPGGFKLGFVKNSGVTSIEGADELHINSYVADKSRYINTKIFNYDATVNGYGYIQFIENNIPVYASCGYSSPDTVNICNQILSTFKFTDSVDTSTWKTYIDTQYGFELKYPPNFQVTQNANSFRVTMPSVSWDVLFIAIFTQKEYKTRLADPVKYPQPLVLSQNNLFVATYNGSQECPDLALCDSNAEIINQILSTFKFTK